MSASLRCITLAALLAWAGPASAGSDQDAGAEPGEEAATAKEMDPRPSQVRAFLQGQLELSVDPSRLFDVPLQNEAALRLEAERVRLMLWAETLRADAGQALRGQPPALAVPVALTDGQLAGWGALVELDRARLEFYSLSPERRAALLQLHADRGAAVRIVETEGERKVREAAVEEGQAREAARLASSEAERVVAEELARVTALEGAIASAQLGFEARRRELAARSDVLLGWQRRAREARTAPAPEVDATYDALRRALRSSRDDLEHVLGLLQAGQSTLPEAGVDGLADVPHQPATEAVRARRQAAWLALGAAEREELALREEQAGQLLEEINALNRERLALLAFLSAEKRTASTGFSIVALDQAQGEGRHLLLTLRAHAQVARRWLSDVRRAGLNGLTVWRLAAVLVPWVLATLAFSWLRRRSPAVLALAETREARADRARRLTRPGPRRRAIAFLRDVHRPLEWLLYFAVLLWLSPPAARGLLEVELVTVILAFSLVGAFVVDAINAVASGDGSFAGATSDQGLLRLRSLRLVGRVVVGFSLALVICSRLVGQGTVYSWVLVACYFAAVPLFLVLVKWWRAAVFERLQRLHRKSRLQVWVLDNRQGWKSFLAAMVGAVDVFGTGALKLTRNWISTFDLTRRGLAWLYKREIDRLAEETPRQRALPLSAPLFEALSPERPSQSWVASPADERIEGLLKRAGNGGVIALVGPRGAGKTSLLARLASRARGALVLHCAGSTRAAEVKSRLGEGVPSLVVLDDAEALIKPLQGGLLHFDEVLALARAEAPDTLWVFSIDDVLWPFLARARDSRPLFDEVLVLEPWSDEEIGALLESRSAEAGVEPVFDDLLENLPAAADEIDRLDALAQRRSGYFRMTWDYARGNPAMALEAWRASLVQGSAGDIRVRPLIAPDSEGLEALPNAALFVLRAVLQFSPALEADLAAATRLPALQVRNALRIGQAQGYYLEERGRVRVASPWLRAVMVHLERRHLLVSQ